MSGSGARASTGVAGAAWHAAFGLSTHVCPEHPSRSARQPRARTRRGARCGDSAPCSSLPARRHASASVAAQRLGDLGSPLSRL